MGLFDEIYNIVPSPFTGVVPSTLQTKDLEQLQIRYNFYEKVDDGGNRIIRAYTSDELAENFLDGSSFFEVYYRVRDGYLVPEAVRVVVDYFPKMKFLSLKKSDYLVYKNGEIVRALVGADYRDILFFLSMLSVSSRVKIEVDAENVLEFRWRGDVIRVEKVGNLPIVCSTCGNVKEFTVREDFINDVALECPYHDFMKENAVYLKFDGFFGWRFFRSFSVLYALADLYRVDVRDRFGLGGVEFYFVELPEYAMDPPVYVMDKKIETYLQ